MKALYPIKNEKNETVDTARVIQLGGQFQAQRLISKHTREEQGWMDIGSRKDTCDEAVAVLR